MLVAVTSFWMWTSIHTWFQGSLFEVQNKTNLAISSGLFVVLLALLAMGLILFRNRLWSVYLGLIVGITYSLIFGVSNINLVGIFILVMLFFHAQDIVSGEINERIKMNSRLLVKKGLGSFIVAFFILMSFAAYQNPAIEEFKNIEKLPSSSEIFIKTIAEQTLGSQLDQVSPQQKELVLNQVAREAVSQINTFLQPYFQYAPPALAFGLFLVLWGVGWIFIWLSVFLGMLLFQILQKTKFFRIEEKDVKAEMLVV